MINQKNYFFDLSYIRVVFGKYGKKMRIERNNINSTELHPASNQKENEKVQQQGKEQIHELSNICYKPMSFGRSWSEHKSWGAKIDPETKEASFKILTFPDTQRVTVTVKKAKNEKEQKEYELKPQGSGIFETAQKIPAGEVEHGDKYFYTIHRANGETVQVKDPYSFRQEKLLGESVIYDHSLYQWHDSNWFANDKRRISRKASKRNGLTHLGAARIYEMNTASVTKDGTFDSAKQVLKKLKGMGFNAVELMPVENTYSFNWGYDGVDKMAPSEHLGGPDQLKDFIDTAHKMGINVIMDIVPNHLGPDGAQLEKTGPYIKGPNAFGSAFNFEGQNSRYVRDYIINSAINWLENYHCDGLRLDMTRFMESDYTMKQLAAEINYHIPEAFIIAEDGRGNDRRVTSSLHTGDSGEGYTEHLHINAIENVSANYGSLDRLGYDSEWDFNYYHTLSDMLYDNIDLNRFYGASMDAQGRVKYISSHDEQGNFEGTAFIAKHMVPMLQLNENVVLDEEDKARAREWSQSKSKPYEEMLTNVKFQKAQFASEKLAIWLQTGKLGKYAETGEKSPERKAALHEMFKKEVLRPLGIREDSGITYDEVKRVFRKSYNKQKLGMAIVYSTPGPKMVFQGDENADLTPFRFFRQFESIKDEPYLYTEKGYKPGKPALDESKMGTIQYSSGAVTYMQKFARLTEDLNILNAENPALTTGRYIPEDTVLHPYSQVIGLHSKDKDSGNEIFTVTNFSEYDYPRRNVREYYIKFPQGKWVEVLNTDSRRYGGNGNTTTDEIMSNGRDNSPIKIAKQSTAIFKRVG